MRRPTTRESVYSVPLTRMSGWTARSSSRGSLCPNMTQKSTPRMPATISARANCGTTGRRRPFTRRAESSPLMPTTSAPPRARAAWSSRAWPRWKRSNTPFVNTRRFPARRRRAHRFSTVSKSVRTRDREAAESRRLAARETSAAEEAETQPRNPAFTSSGTRPAPSPRTSQEADNSTSSSAASRCQAENDRGRRCRAMTAYSWS